MKLTQFKKGDIIHRTKPKNGDYSFMAEPIMFLQIESGIMFYKYCEWDILKGVRKLSTYDADDGNWDYFPIETYKKLQEEYKDDK